VKEKGGDAFGHPLEMIDGAKARNVRLAAAGWLAARPELAGLDVEFEAVGVRGGSVERVPLT
jgi:Holliday junction resolvase-like predicted endonuclease